MNHVIRVYNIIFYALLFVFLAQDCFAWWSWSQPGEHSTHHQISEAAYQLSSSGLNLALIKNQEWMGYTYLISNDVAAHGGNETRNGGDIETLFKSFLNSFNAADFGSASKYLGYCVHLIEDMHVPAHAYNIKHAGLDTGVPDLFEYLASSMTPSANEVIISDLESKYIIKPTLIYQDTETQTKSTVEYYGFSGYFHTGSRGGKYANWNGDGPKGYYTVEIGTVYESLDFDLFPGGHFSAGIALLQNQLNEASKNTGRFLLAVDKLLSFTPVINQTFLAGQQEKTYVLSGAGFVPSGRAAIHLRKADGSEIPTQTVKIDSGSYFKLVYSIQQNMEPPVSWWAVDESNGKKSNELALAGAPVTSGDCDKNGAVDISEVQGAINMFLGLKKVVNCVDVDNDGAVSISEVQKVINSFLGI